MKKLLTAILLMLLCVSVNAQLPFIFSLSFPKYMVNADYYSHDVYTINHCNTLQYYGVHGTPKMIDYKLYNHSNSELTNNLVLHFNRSGLVTKIEEKMPYTGVLTYNYDSLNRVSLLNYKAFYKNQENGWTINYVYSGSKKTAESTYITPLKGSTKTAHTSLSDNNNPEVSQYQDNRTGEETFKYTFNITSVGAAASVAISIENLQELENTNRNYDWDKELNFSLLNVRDNFGIRIAKLDYMDGIGYKLTTALAPVTSDKYGKEITELEDIKTDSVGNWTEAKLTFSVGDSNVYYYDAMAEINY